MVDRVRRSIIYFIRIVEGDKRILFNNLPIIYFKLFNLTNNTVRYIFFYAQSFVFISNCFLRKDS